MNNSFFFSEIRALVIPKQKWHWWFHFAVILVAASYWIGALITLPSHSLSEAILYRPSGDTEYYPIISALSHFNFGDPTDALNHGRGLASYPFVGSLPHAMACTLFGKAGFVVADLLVSWLYFICVMLFFRACGMGGLSCLIIGSGLATNGLQVAFLKVSEALNQMLGTFGVQVFENGFPGLLNLSIYEKRVPRPMVMEIVLVLLLYFIVRLWRKESRPTWKDGLAIGALFGLLLQGDFYSTFSLALLMAGMMAWVVLRNWGKTPWQFFIGGGIGSLLTGWIFVLQRLHEHSDIPRRYGLASYPRSHIMWLPGYASILRVAIICGLVYVVLRVVRSRPGESEVKDKRRPAKAPVAVRAGWRSCGGGAVEKDVALFFVALLVAAFFAQPVQIFLLGKGTQIYHYLFNVPVYYSYALVILLYFICKLVSPPQFKTAMHNLAEAPKTWGAVFLAALLVVQALLAMETPFEAISYAGNPRHASSDTEPWGAMGNNYRPNLRVLEEAFSTNTVIRSAQTFATFDFDINVLLTTFHGKRAYNPDPFLSTLRDDEIENRFCELNKILGVQPGLGQFGTFIQMYYIVCYSLGHNKYHFASDHRFSTDDDYSPESMSLLARMPKQWGWTLIMPNSEVKRMTEKYVAAFSRKSDPSSFPDLIILTVYERNMGLTPSPELYDPVPISSQAFYVYSKKEPTAALETKANRGAAQAQFQLGRRYLAGEGVAVNWTNAFSWFRKSADQGLADAEFQMGICYAQGVGTVQDYAASILWFRKAAEQGNNDASYNLGQIYENGLGVKADLAEATIWYHRAGEKGHALAQNSLGMICCNVRKDFAEAAQWFQRAADQGNGPAQNSLGVLYMQGLGVKQDPGEAFKWFQKSADSGFPEGQNNLGLFLYGQQRMGEAAQWFHRAADQSHPGAQFNLGQFYERGVVYPLDLAEAVLWYSRSARQGNSPAQFHLGQMYHTGAGVKPDNVEAYKWFKLAQNQGLPEAANELTNCAAAMSPNELKAAEAAIQPLSR